jgi:2-phospho-L-lactate guanylyltransferase
MMRPAWAVVPCKTLARGKSRLRPVFDDDARASFARGLLEHVLRVLSQSELDGVLVATDGDDVAAIATAYGAHVRRDRGEGSLAAVVDQALEDVEARGARAALVLMADLPRIEPTDVVEVLRALEGRDVVLSCDHRGQHTNALAVAPPTAIRTCFGRKDSFAAHRAAARASGLALAIVDNERVAFDVDAPSDHARLTGRPFASGT